ncbi:MAG: SRPBCC domain-containing protein [Flavobacteriaceae bacterium]
MKKPLWVSLVVPLKISRESLWRVLTDPHYTQQYMFNCQLHCSWKVGTQVHWVEIAHNGKETVHVSGELLEYSPHNCLRFKIKHTSNDAKGYSSELKFLVSPDKNGVLLSIVQGDFSHFPHPEKIYQDCLKGWQLVLKDLKATCLKAT